MDALTFIAKLVEFSAWPAASVVVVLLLRKEIRRLLLLVKKFKAGPIEAEFEREIIELSESTKSLPMPSALPPSITIEKEALVSLARIDPRAAIVEAWREVEATVLHTVDQQKLSIPDRDLGSPAAIIRALAREGLLSAERVAHFHQLRELRNRAAHEEEFSPSMHAALAYVELSSRLRVALGSISRI
jgi:hypothetical protein